MSLLHLVISLVNLDNVVWVVNWESGVLIAEGVPMYEQTGQVVLPSGETHKLPPDHFPLYFYFIAAIVWIFGPSQYVARTITWFFVVATALVLYDLIRPKTERTWIGIQLLFFLDPQLIVTNYYGKFDQIAVFFILLGLSLLVKERYLLSGTVFGLGIMIKFFPAFGFLVGGAYLLRRKRFTGFFVYSVSGVVTAGGIFTYHLLRWGDQFLSVVVYQVQRQTPSLSIWYYILPDDISGTTLLLPQLLIFVLVGLMFLALPMERSTYFPFLGTSVLTATFLSVTRQYYATYAYFMAVPLIPVIFHWYKQQRYNFIAWAIIPYVVFNLGAVFCYNSCYPQILPFTFFSWIGVILVFVGSVAIIPLYPFAILSEES